MFVVWEESTFYFGVSQQAQSGQHRHRVFSSQQNALLGSTASCGVRAAAPLRPVGAERGRANTVITTRRCQLLLSPSFSPGSCCLRGRGEEKGSCVRNRTTVPSASSAGSNTTPTNDKEADLQWCSVLAGGQGRKDSPGSGAGSRALPNQLDLRRNSPHRDFKYQMGN